MKDERKVRATESTPLPKIEAIGDNRVRQKRMTARYNTELRKENRQVG